MLYLQHNGVKLAYAVSGHGTPPIVLIHGWCDNHATLAAMAAHFSARHQVVSVDLRSHGHSDKLNSPCTIATFADDLAWMCCQLGVQKPVIVGHSLGGAVALELAARYPNLPDAIVALEGIILFPPHGREGAQPLVEVLRTPSWRVAMHGFIDLNFSPTDDHDLRRKAHEELDRLPQYMHASVGEQALLWDAAAAARACRVPVLYVDAGSGLSNLTQFKALCPQLVIGRTVGVGHNQMVRTPGQVNAMIERFIALELHRAGVDQDALLVM